MRKLLIFALLVSSCFAATNSITVKETRGNAQTNYVFGGQRDFARVFAEGEAPSGSCPKPVVDGVAVPTNSWQANIHNTWADGSAKEVYLAWIIPSVSANGTSTTTFTNVSTGSVAGACDGTGGLNKAGMLAFNSSNWGAQILVTANGQTVTSDAVAMLTALSVTAGQIEIIRDGPVETQIKLDDRTGAFTYDFGWHFTLPSTMADCSGSPCATTSTFASLHPEFILTFVRSLNVVRVEFRLENMWLNRTQDQQYTFELKTGGTPTQVYNHASTFTHVAHTAWSKVFWSGSAPQALQVDYNFPYLISSKAIPCYDGQPGAGCVDRTDVSVIADVTQTGTANNGMTSYAQFVAGVGVTPIKCDLGFYCINAQLTNWSDNSEQAPMRREDLLYLYNMGALGTDAAKAWLMLTGESLIASLDSDACPGGCGTWTSAGLINEHMRDTASSVTFYCNNFDPLVNINALSNASCGTGTGNTIGRPLSRHARQTGLWSGNSYGSASGDSTDGGMSPDPAHWQNFNYFGAVITGNRFLEEEQFFEASWLPISINPDCAAYNSCGYFAWMNGATRVQSQMVEFAKAAFLAADSSPESLYYTAILNSNNAVREGYKGFINGSGGITSTLTPTSTLATCSGYDLNATNRWNFGHCGYGYGASPTSLGFPLLHRLYTGFNSDSEVNLGQSAISASTSANPAVLSVSASTQTEAQSVANPPWVWGFGTGWTGLNTTDATNLSAASANTGAHTITLTGRTSSGFPQPSTGTAYVGANICDWSKSTDITEDWIDNFLILSMQQQYRMGYTLVGNSLNDSKMGLIERLLDNTFNPYLFSDYESPVKGSGTQWPPPVTTNPTNNPYFSTWAAVLGAFVPPVQSPTTGINTYKNATYDNACAFDHVYGLVGYAAAQSTYGTTDTCTQGSCTGAQAVSFLQSHFPYFNNSPTGSTGCGVTSVQLSFALAPESTLIADTCAITAPTAAQSISGTFNFTGTNTPGQGSANGMVFTVDGSSIGSQSGSSPYSQSYDTTLLTNGAHTAACTCSDDGGGSGTCSGIAFTVSNGSSSTTGMLGSSILGGSLH